MITPKLHRHTFRSSRLLEYFTAKELTLQTGHEPDRWAEVVVKELIDKSLDACEEAGTLPASAVDIGSDQITITDNGPGLPGAAVERVKCNAFCATIRRWPGMRPWRASCPREPGRIGKGMPWSAIALPGERISAQRARALSRVWAINAAFNEMKR